MLDSIEKLFYEDLCYISSESKQLSVSSI